MTNTPKNHTVDVYSAGEIAQAAGVPVARVEALIDAGKLRRVAQPGAAALANGVAQGSSPAFFAQADAVAAVRSLRADGGRSAAMLFDRPEFVHASPRLPIAVSSAFHAGIAASFVLISMIGLPQAAEPVRLQSEPVTTRLVFIPSPGPGGGGGGGGLRQKAPPPRAQRKGKVITRQPDSCSEGAQTRRTGSRARASATAARCGARAPSAGRRTGCNGCCEPAGSPRRDRYAGAEGK